MPVLVAGVVALLVGLALLGYGLAPAAKLGAIGGAFSGSPDPNLAPTIEAAIAELKARALFDILGFVGILGGIVALKNATKKPKPKTLEEQVAEEVARRLGEKGNATGGLAASVLAGSVAPEGIAPAPAAPAPLVVPIAPAPSVSSTVATPVPTALPTPLAEAASATSPLAGLAGAPGHCARCGRTLLGGRFCRVCDR